MLWSFAGGRTTTTLGGGNEPSRDMCPDVLLDEALLVEASPRTGEVARLDALLEGSHEVQASPGTGVSPGTRVSPGTGVRAPLLDETREVEA